ncbi:SH3 domain-containing protein [Duganella sp. sic0402]|uniref:SH3 domain-containing protein n=1 Tax=Duganella sp. sic0402 TaxID=2854786 RepID=UPI001C43CA7E|nr:SH3 domain-containing protein [Duganella sp. sic0402]MBV7534306.1 SH3 domain-containing protein [Duganella sp. sic0402]
MNAVLAFAAGLLITLFLAAYLTPRAWWRRLNARALCIAVAGAWSFGSLILYALQAPASAIAAETPPTPAPRSAAMPPAAGKPFRVHRDLNLRSAPGVHAPRMAVVPAGVEVTPTGVQDGDWWQISATLHGSENTGWVSSLWLRRSGE